MLMAFDMAGLPLGHVAFEVSVQVTASVFDGIYVYVLLFVPALVPFTFHWYAGVGPPFVGVAV